MKQWGSHRTGIIYILDGFYSDFRDINSNIVSAMKAAAVRYDAKQPNTTEGNIKFKVLYVNRINSKWMISTQAEHDQMSANYVALLRRRDAEAVARLEAQS